MYTLREVIMVIGSDTAGTIIDTDEMTYTVGVERIAKNEFILSMWIDGKQVNRQWVTWGEMMTLIDNIAETASWQKEIVLPQRRWRF